MIIVSFTAARQLSSEAAVGVVTSVLAVRVPLAGRYVTGACTGGDAFAGWWLAVNRPAARHTVVVPANRSRVDRWWERFPPGAIEVLEMLPGTTYADRNQVLVDLGTMMFGFPAWPEADPRSERSGTWQAIRMARRAGKLSQWHCVTPPYRGCIERSPQDFLPQPGRVPQ